MKTKDIDNVKIIKHGKSYDKSQEKMAIYPFHICPECMGTDTEVVLDPLARYHRTGDYHYVNSGLLRKKMVYANHFCKECGCEFQTEFEDREGKKFADMDPDKAALIICILLSIITIISLICVITVIKDLKAFDLNVSYEINLWFIGSVIGTMVCVMFGGGAAACL